MALPTLYLHHYPMSPFAEKARLMLGHKRLTWKSVLIPPVMPKPDVVALTGGYRKTPLLQVGNDVFCDTALIADVLEHIAPQPSFYPHGQQGLNRVVAQWADHQLFWVAMGYNFQPAGLQHVFEGAPTEAVKAFAADRSAMASGMTRIRPADAAGVYKLFLQRLQDMLGGSGGPQPFLLGPAPSLADFAAYHPLWFTQQRVPHLAHIVDSAPAVRAWWARMHALGYGTVEESSSVESIAASAYASRVNDRFDLKIWGDHPPFQDEHGLPLGSRVTVAAESFGTEASEGVLLAATDTRYTIERTDPRAGTVRVHFPRTGYVLKAAA